MFDHIINWKLKTGSHEFPGPDGGTCINEAAIVAAGFKYQRVQCASDMPKCFSLVFSGFLLALNDLLPDVPRQRLIKYVPYLAGTADTEGAERDRALNLGMSLSAYLGHDIGAGFIARPTVGIGHHLGKEFFFAKWRERDNYHPRAHHISEVLRSQWQALPEKDRNEKYAQDVYRIDSNLEAAMQALDKAMLIGNQPTALDVVQIDARITKAKQLAAVVS